VRDELHESNSQRTFSSKVINSFEGKCGLNLRSISGYQMGINAVLLEI
jgi:hypothetical protein